MLEIWNLVFIQFNRESETELRPLPRRSIDTGMGLERLVSILQGATSNYDTDLFRPLFEAIREATGARPYAGRVGAEDADGADTAYRVLADHARTLAVALSDGGRPHSTGRGYVLRRILRRAVLYSAKLRRAKEGGEEEESFASVVKMLEDRRGFFSSLVDVVAESLGDTFPELRKDPTAVKGIIDDEERQFLETLNRGCAILDRKMESLGAGAQALHLPAQDGAPPGTTIPGDVAWLLYSTYGLPLDLIVLIGEKRRMAVDLDAFERERAAARLRSHGGKGAGDQEHATLDVCAIGELQSAKVPPTDDGPKHAYGSDAGGNYAFERLSSRVLALRRGRAFVERVAAGEECGVVLDRTCFYAEQGGQTFDEGYMFGEGGDGDGRAEFAVRNVQARGGYVVHAGTLHAGRLAVGDRVALRLDEARRTRVMSNHTATHLLNFALRHVLGPESEQRGSLVAPDFLRFDFARAGGGPLTGEEFRRVEEAACAEIAAARPVYSADAPLAEARAVRGLRAAFGEAYPDPARVVSVGVPVGELLADPGGDGALRASAELCGGTHLRNTGHAESLALVSEEAVGKGVRRLVAVTGAKAKEAHARVEALRRSLSELAGRAEAAESLPDRRDARREIADMTEALAAASISRWAKDEMRDALKAQKKAVDDLERAGKERVRKRVLESTGRAIEVIGADPGLLVMEVEGGATAKALNEALKMLRVRSPRTAALLLAADVSGEADSAAVCLCQVPREVAAECGLKASEWAAALCPLLGGRSGGTDLSAQVAGGNAGRMREALQAGEEFAQSKLAPQHRLPPWKDQAPRRDLFEAFTTPLSGPGGSRQIF